ncbi:hypothetical protein V6N12_009919 [Hibiscus sabdariffa]|uniref:Uncharacterized protein n=1 Tax=Hibiscus sabdariffa TaxID=183260 RepID=A0ABR2EC49_9ROSI
MLTLLSPSSDRRIGSNLVESPEIDAAVVNHPSQPPISVVGRLSPINNPSACKLCSDSGLFLFALKSLLINISHPPALLAYFTRIHHNRPSKPLPFVSSSSSLMADSSNPSIVSVEDAAKFGFTRDEMYSTNL